jgi:SWI/SNF-related matrix-associated actin-dependent regulator of chromatin subfamily A3
MLCSHNISFTRMDGALPALKRAEAVHNFNNDPAIRVFLMSITCGGVGYEQMLAKIHPTDKARLTLTSASRAYIMEPQWNPALEEQALDRIHRIGQTQPVTTVRFIMEKSFEQVKIT